jgi:hypothetical protein
MSNIIQKLTFRPRLVLLAAVVVVAIPLVAGGVASAALPKTATWTKKGYVSYNGKIYSAMRVEAPHTQNVQVHFLLPAEASSNCPTSEIVFPTGDDLSPAPETNSATYATNQGNASFCAPGASRSITFTNTRPSTATTGTDGLDGITTDGTNQSNLETCTDNGGYQGDPALCNTPCKSGDKCDLVTKYIDPIINKFLAPLAIIAVIIGVLWGAIRYITSGGDAQKVAEGKDKIQKALLGLLAFIFLYALLNWLLPGGL